VHEVIKEGTMPPPRGLLGAELNPGARLEGPGSVLDYHTHSDEVGCVATAADAKRLVLSHIVFAGPTEALGADAQCDYAGPVEVGEDLQQFVLE
jgi:ribonuclease BN (tRNA processing enzyme)